MLDDTIVAEFLGDNTIWNETAPLVPVSTIAVDPEWWLSFNYEAYCWKNFIPDNYVVIQLGGQGNYFTVVSPEDAERVLKHNWTVTIKKDPETGQILKVYAWRSATKKEREKGAPKQVYLHRYLAGVIYAGPKTIVDHGDGRGLNNTRGNLTVTNGAGNNANAVRANRSGLPRGVEALRGRKPIDGVKPIIGYRASIKINGKKRNSKKFSTAERASRWYQRMHRTIYPVSTICTGQGSGAINLPPKLVMEEIPF